MRKTLKFVHLVCVTSLVISCASCKEFDWDARPWVGDHNKKELVSYNNERMRCDQPAFSRMTCFDEENIAELKTAISKVNMSKDDRKKINKAFRRLESFREKVSR